jgi:hypothetical protein
VELHLGVNNPAVASGYVTPPFSDAGGVAWLDWMEEPTVRLVAIRDRRPHVLSEWMQP